MKIREFKIEDYQIVRDLWQTAGLTLRPGDELDDVRLKLQRDPDLFLVAEEDERILGSVIGGWDGRRGWIYHLAVNPEHQRKGIGMGLVREVEKRLIAKGAKKVNAQVYKWNERSSEFFKAIGYEAQPDLIMIGKQLTK
jgi:ribosomal protein S18 acetylase RimI-like enzyme